MRLWAYAHKSPGGWIGGTPPIVECDCPSWGTKACSRIRLRMLLLRKSSCLLFIISKLKVKEIICKMNLFNEMKYSINGF